MTIPARERLFWPATAALLAYLCAVQIGSALQECATADEPVELAAGYTYLKTGDYRMNPEHPPLAKILAALPPTVILFPVTSGSISSTSVSGRRLRNME